MLENTYKLMFVMFEQYMHYLMGYENQSVLYEPCGSHLDTSKYEETTMSKFPKWIYLDNLVEEAALNQILYFSFQLHSTYPSHSIICNGCWRGFSIVTLKCLVGLHGPVPIYVRNITILASPTLIFWVYASDITVPVVHSRPDITRHRVK